MKGSNRIISRPPVSVALINKIRAQVFTRANSDAVLGRSWCGNAHWIDLAIAILVGSVVPGSDHNAEIIMIPNEGVELPALCIVSARVAPTPRVGMNARAPCICCLEKLGEILRNPRQKVTTISLPVVGIDPVKLLFDGLENQTRFIRKSAHRTIHAGHTVKRRAVAKDRPTHVRSVAAIEIGRAIISAGIIDVICIVRCDRITHDRLDAFAKINVHTGFLSGVDPGISYGNDFAPAAQTKSGMRHGCGSPHDPGRDVVGRAFDRAFANLAHTMNS